MSRASSVLVSPTQIGDRLEAHKTTNRAYYEDGIKILELANRAYSLYVQQSPHEQHRLLNVLLWNCNLTNGTLCSTYKKPFDLLAQRVKNEEWLGLGRILYTFETKSQD